MVKVSLIYCGHQIDYLYGLISGFEKNSDVYVDVIDSLRTNESLNSTSRNIKILKILDPKGKNFFYEMKRWIKYYIKLTIYLFKSDTEVIHIEWINRKIDVFEHFYFILIKAITKKKIIFKVHDLDTNVLLVGGVKNHSKLKFSNLFFLRNCDAIITHNSYVKSILINNGINENKINIIPHGINNYQTFNTLSKSDARIKLGLDAHKKVLLFYGNIRAYKGLDHLLQICENLSPKYKSLHLIIAGKNDIIDKDLKEKIHNKILKLEKLGIVSYYPGFVSSKDTEMYFKGSNALVLPYKFIYQSGLPFLSFAAGLPVICTDAGGIPEDIVKNKNGYYETFEKFESVIIKFLNEELLFLQSDDIIFEAQKKYNWKRIITKKIKIYEKIR